MQLAGGTKEENHYGTNGRLLSPASFLKSSDNNYCERSTQNWNLQHGAFKVMEDCFLFGLL